MPPVKGIDLRVVDASIVPEVPSTVTNLTVIMIAERILDRDYRRYLARLKVEGCPQHD